MGISKAGLSNEYDNKLLLAEGTTSYITRRTGDGLDKFYSQSFADLHLVVVPGLANIAIENWIIDPDDPINGYAYTFRMLKDGFDFYGWAEEGDYNAGGAFANPSGEGISLTPVSGGITPDDPIGPGDPAGVTHQTYILGEPASPAISGKLLLQYGHTNRFNANGAPPAPLPNSWLRIDDYAEDESGWTATLYQDPPTVGWRVYQVWNDAEGADPVEPCGPAPHPGWPYTDPSINIGIGPGGSRVIDRPVHGYAGL